jgi:hypothetical protein
MYQIIKEARKPPYHFINQNLNRLWSQVHFDVCRNLKICLFVINLYIKFDTSLIRQMYIKKINYKCNYPVKITLK